MEVKEWYAKELQGLSLKNIEIHITDGKKKLYDEFGEMLFTHYGVTGPVILSASSIVGKTLEKKNWYCILILSRHWQKSSWINVCFGNLKPTIISSLKMLLTVYFQQNYVP